mmetsp:Transcript_7653/g.27237  ORF Transcript_7653/g.27237 Transcript_7653/m.27237 type:complete len:218 (+) Transcript_7653:524-1177(+)
MVTRLTSYASCSASRSMVGGRSCAMFTRSFTMPRSLAPTVSARSSSSFSSVVAKASTRAVRLRHAASTSSHDSCTYSSERCTRSSSSLRRAKILAMRSSAVASSSLMRVDAASTLSSTRAYTAVRSSRYRSTVASCRALRLSATRLRPASPLAASAALMPWWCSDLTSSTSAARTRRPSAALSVRSAANAPASTVSPSSPVGSVMLFNVFPATAFLW